MSLLKDIADALAASLAVEEFAALDAQPTVERLNWPTYDVENLRSPVLAVTPVGVELTRVSRTAHQYDYQVAVFIGRHTPTEAKADAMVEFAEDVIDLIREHEWDEGVEWPAGVTSPVAVDVEINPDEGLTERNAWRAVVTVTYRTHKD